jgi:PAS domain S-box-containing protein
MGDYMMEQITLGKKASRHNNAQTKGYLTLLDSLNTMQDSRDYYAALYEYAPTGYAVLDQKGYIKDINHAGALLLGAKRSSLLNMPLSAYIAQVDIIIFLNHLRKCNKVTKPVLSDITLINSHQEMQLMSMRISTSEPAYIGTIIIDVAEKKSNERDIARLDRLQIIGEMSAAIAHEIRNPMTTVLGYLQLFQKRTQLADYYDQFSLMAEELLRANSIITEFLSLAKNKAFNPNYLDLNQIITNIYPLINAEALLQGKSIFLGLSAALPLVLFDETEIRQVIVNLTRNGLQSMDKGLLHIQTYIAHDNVVLAIQDQGPGMSKETQAKIGTPFFTTKTTGTGLGLPVCFNIAARHKAKLKYKTGSEGTTFFLEFGPDTLRERMKP